MSYVNFVSAIRTTREVQSAIATDHEHLIDLVLNIEKITDPEDPDHVRAKRDVQGVANVVKGAHLDVQGVAKVVKGAGVVVAKGAHQRVVDVARGHIPGSIDHGEAHRRAKADSRR